MTTVPELCQNTADHHLILRFPTVLKHEERSQGIDLYRIPFTIQGLQNRRLWVRFHQSLPK